MVGRSLVGRTLGVFAFISVGLILLAITSTGSLAMWCLVGVGIFNSIMWSNIFTIAIDRLGKYTSQGSSLLIMAILGAALIPISRAALIPISQGVLADAIGLQRSFVIPMLCYGYLIFYGFYSPRFRKNLL